jgi:hypothetical protein
VLSQLRQNPAQMNLHVRLVWTRGERPVQKLFGLSKRALIFTDQAQELQSVRLARVGGEHLRQHRFGLLPFAMPQQVRSL